MDTFLSFISNQQGIFSTDIMFFVCGVIFAYSGLLTFLAGFLTGFYIRWKFVPEIQ